MAVEVEEGGPRSPGAVGPEGILLGVGSHTNPPCKKKCLHAWFWCAIFMRISDINYLRELADLQGLCQETSAKMAYAILAQD